MRCAIGNGHKILIVSVSVRDHQGGQGRPEWPSGSEGVLVMQSLKFRNKCAVASCGVMGVYGILVMLYAFLETLNSNRASLQRSLGRAYLTLFVNPRKIKRIHVRAIEGRTLRGISG